MKSERRLVRRAGALLLFAALTAVLVTAMPFRGVAEGAGSAKEIVIEWTTGRVLYALNADERAYPASTTKILTALVVAETLPLDLEVTVPAVAAVGEGSSV